jgi:hypothetical protein
MTAETRVEGWAGLSVEAAVEVASEPLRRAVDVLRGSGVEFMVTGPSVLTRFHHHLPRRLIHLVYVVDGAGEFAVTSLRGRAFGLFLTLAGGRLTWLLKLSGMRA